MAAKSTSDAYSAQGPFPPDPNSPQSTISTVEREIREAGGEATAIPVDVRDFAAVQSLVDRTVEVGNPTLARKGQVTESRDLNLDKDNEYSRVRT